MDGLEYGESPLVLIKYKWSIICPSIHIPRRKSHVQRHFWEGTSDAVFLFKRRESKWVISPLQLGWTDGQAGSPEERGVLWVGCNPLMDWRHHDNLTHFPYLKDNKSMLFSGSGPLQAILELQGKQISLQKCRSLLLLVSDVILGLLLNFTLGTSVTGNLSIEIPADRNHA